MSTEGTIRYALGRIELDFYNNTAVEKKTHAIRELCEQLRKDHNVSAREIDAEDAIEYGVLGFSMIFPTRMSTATAQDRIEKLMKQLEEISPMRVVREEWDLFEEMLEAGDGSPP